MEDFSNISNQDPALCAETPGRKTGLFLLRKIILMLLVCFISSSVMAQKVDLDTLNTDQLNLYKEKAAKMKRTGMILTSCGVGTVFASYVVGVMIGDAPSDAPTGTLSDYAVSLGVIFIGGTVGIASAVVGIPLWLTGNNRKTKAELTLQKFNIAPENSMAVGLGITISF